MIRETIATSSGQLSSLVHTGLAHLFQNWRGRSGRRVICSVYALKASPAFDPTRAVMFAVRPHGQGGEILFACADLPDEAAFSRRCAEAAALGATQWHVHLLAPTPAERRAVMVDISSLWLKTTN